MTTNGDHRSFVTTLSYITTRDHHGKSKIIIISYCRVLGCRRRARAEFRRPLYRDELRRRRIATGSSIQIERTHAQWGTRDEWHRRGGAHWMPATRSGSGAIQPVISNVHTNHPTPNQTTIRVHAHNTNIIMCFSIIIPS